MHGRKLKPDGYKKCGYRAQEHNFPREPEPYDTGILEKNSEARHSNPNKPRDNRNNVQHFDSFISLELLNKYPDLFYFVKFLTSAQSFLIIQH